MTIEAETISAVPYIGASKTVRPIMFPMTRNARPKAQTAAATIKRAEEPLGALNIKQTLVEEVDLGNYSAPRMFFDAPPEDLHIGQFRHEFRPNV